MDNDDKPEKDRDRDSKTGSFLLRFARISPLHGAACGVWLLGSILIAVYKSIPDGYYALCGGAVLFTATIAWSEFSKRRNIIEARAMLWLTLIGIALVFCVGIASYLKSTFFEKPALKRMEDSTYGLLNRMTEAQRSASRVITAKSERTAGQPTTRPDDDQAVDESKRAGSNLASVETEVQADGKLSVPFREQWLSTMYLLHAMVSLIQNDTREASAALEKIDADAPTFYSDPKHMLMIAVAYQESRYNDVIRLRESVDPAPQFYAIDLLVADAEVHEGNLPAAKSRLCEIIDYHTRHDHPAYANLGSAEIAAAHDYSTILLHEKDYAGLLKFARLYVDATCGLSVRQIMNLGDNDALALSRLCDLYSEADTMLNQTNVDMRVSDRAVDIASELSAQQGRPVERELYVGELYVKNATAHAFHQDFTTADRRLADAKASFARCSHTRLSTVWDEMMHLDYVKTLINREEANAKALPVR